jgi:hypothetical protein
VSVGLAAFGTIGLILEAARSKRMADAARIPEEALPWRPISGHASLMS